MSESTTPKFMKTTDGFCYVYAPALAKLKHLTPYDGEIDKHGIAVDAPGVALAEAPKEPRQVKKAKE